METRNSIEVEDQRVRLDKWLWAARFYKTRSLAVQAIEAGRVRVGQTPVKASREVHVDDLIRLRMGEVDWEVRVRRLATVRGSAGIAQTMYAETETSMAARAQQLERRKVYREPSVELKGRPTKRDRRQLDRLRSV